MRLTCSTGINTTKLSPGSWCSSAKGHTGIYGVTWESLLHMFVVSIYTGVRINCPVC